jgi:hypothetical protein
MITHQLPRDTAHTQHAELTTMFMSCMFLLMSGSCGPVDHDVEGR